MQTQKDHQDLIFETKVVQEEPVHPMLGDTGHVSRSHHHHNHHNHHHHDHHNQNVILESHVHNTSNAHLHPQHFHESHHVHIEQPYQSSAKHIVKKNYETHINHIKTNQDKFVRENEKLKKHYEDYIFQLESENKRLQALERELEILKDKRRILEADILKLKTELEMIQQSPTNSYEVEELQKQVKKLEHENIELMDIINIKKNQIIELEENIDVNNTEVELERKRLHERITYLKHQISIKKPEVIVKEIVKEKFFDLPPLEPKIVQKFVAPPIVYKECNCGCICHEESVAHNKQQSTSYFAQRQHTHDHSHHHNVNHYTTTQHHNSNSNINQRHEHIVQSKQPLFDQHDQSHYYDNQHQQQNQTIRNVQTSERRSSQYREHYGSPRVSEMRVTGITETIQKGNDVQTKHYDTEQQYKQAKGHNALF